MQVLCFDIGGTNIKYGVVEENLKRIDVNSFKISYILGYDNKVAMLCENYDKIKDVENRALTLLGGDKMAYEEYTTAIKVHTRKNLGIACLCTI